MSKGSRVVVVGSINEDLIFECERLPRAGETVVSRRTSSSHGGKGGNQASAASEWGATTLFIGRVGADHAGSSALGDLRSRGVDVSLVDHVAGLPTGRAIVMVDGAGENSIVVDPGANGALDASYVARTLAEARLRIRDVVVTSGEIASAVVECVSVEALRVGARHMHNLSPVRSGWTPVQDTLVVVNEGEARELAEAADSEDVAEIWDRLPADCVVTMGASGAAYREASGVAARVPGVSVDAVDTTGAGDATCGVLAAELAREIPLSVAVRRAMRAGAAATTARGARGALSGFRGLSSSGE